METELTVHTLQGDYPVYIGDDCFYRAREHAKGRIMAVSDSNVAPLYMERLKEVLRGFEVFTFVVEQGEQSKCKERLFDIINALAEKNFNREDTVIALGGGVVGDLAGLCAGLYMRGIRLIMMPTTLLSMVDSSCGGKVAVNLSWGKNMVGMFYQPSCVIASMNTLSTLDEVQIQCGAAEMIKYGCIHDKRLFELLKNKDNLLLPATVKRCVEVKNHYVSRDTFDKGERMLLNFGHTVGHGVEKATGLLHGQAIAVGMYEEALLGERLGVTQKGTADKIKEILSIYGLEHRSSREDIGKYILHDKKSGGDGISFGLIEEIGKGKIVKLPYETVEEEVL